MKYNDIKTGSQMTIGFLVPILTALAEARSYLYAITQGTEFVISQNFPIYTQAAAPADFIDSCRQAVQGASVKAFAMGKSVAATPLVIGLGTVTVFGVRVKINDSPLNFKYGVVHAQLFDLAVSSTVPLVDVYVRTATNCNDFVMLAINNNGGQASITKILQPQVTLVATDSQSFGTLECSVESLNARDLGFAPK